MVTPAFFHYGIEQGFNQGKPVSVGLTEFEVIQVVLNRKGHVVEEMLASTRAIVYMLELGFIVFDFVQ